MFSASRHETQRAHTLLSGKDTSFSERMASSFETTEQDLPDTKTKLNDFFVSAGYSYSEARKTKLFILAEIILLILISVTLQSIKVPIIGVIGIFFQLLFVRQKIFTRAYDFEKDYPALLLSLATSVRTGQDPIYALKEASILFDDQSVITKELELFKKNIDKGMQEENAIRSFAKSIHHPDLYLFRLALILARREGSSLTECLRRLVKVTRQRQSFRRKIKSSLAMQRLASFAIVGCAIFIAGFQYTANREMVDKALSSPVGGIFIGVGITMITIGFIMMRLVARTKI